MRLIDADKLDVYEMRFRSELELCDYIGMHQEEIVRCKHSEVNDGYFFCNKIGIAMMPDDWFCADGERREDALD